MTALKLALIPAFVLGLAACNTVSGVGQDLQSGGSAISNAAEDAKE